MEAPTDTLTWLGSGEIELLGRFVDSWNAVFLVQVDDGQHQGQAIYKPRRGEYPLWDFPNHTLCLREVAAYRLSQALGWPNVPPTLLRDGPLGPGMFQLYIDADPQATYFSLREHRRPDLQPVALFDVLTNNADRKGGHLLLDKQGLIWAIDHALTFHVEPKLRTVIWDFVDEPIPGPYPADLRRLRRTLQAGQPLAEELAGLLSPTEVDALRERLKRLLVDSRFPQPDPHRRHLPWPLV